MSYDYIKSISGDFPNAIVSGGLLKYQIDNDGGISTSLNYIKTSGDDCTMNFVSEPSGGEKTAIDALVTAHTTALIATWDNSTNCPVQNTYTTAERDALLWVDDGLTIFNSDIDADQIYNGSIWITPSLLQTKAINYSDSPYSVLDSDGTLIADATDGLLIINLPPATDSVGRPPLKVKRINEGANAVQLDGYLSETIDGSETVDIDSQNASLTIESDGSNWIII